jgi:hypothetical protein
MLTISRSLSIKGRSFLSLLMLGTTLAFAQFTDFQGGKLYLNMEGNMSPFALGSNTGARGSMSNVTSLYPTASSLFGNPAALGRLQGISVQTDFFLPGLGLGISSERTKLLRNNMKAPIQEFLNTANNRVEHPVYPDVSLGLYQSTNLGGFAVAFGGPSATLSAGVQQPLRGKLDFGLGGLRIGLGLPEDEADPQSDSIKVLVSADAFARFTVEMNNFSLGLAGMPWPNVRLGLAYQRYTIDMLLEAGARVDGILQRAGQENYFHGEGVNYHDDLDAHGNGQVRGSAHGIRAGADWQFAKHFGLDAMVSLAEVMHLQGTLGWEYNVLPSLDFSSEKIMNPANMNPTKLTLTTRSKSVIQEMKVNLPWEGALSLHTNWENFKMNLDYSYFLRGMSILYTSIDSVDAFDSTTKDLYHTFRGRDSVTVTRGDNRFRLGLEQQFALGIQVYQVFFQMGGIVYTVENGDLLSESAAYRPASLPFLPTVNMGYYFPLGPNFTATVSLVAFPVSLFKTSVEYRY